MAQPVTRDRVNVGLILLTTAVGVSVWSRLPAEMAIHFTASGTPDTFVPRVLGVTLVPLLMVLVLPVVEWAGRVDPPSDPTVIVFVTRATLVLLLAVHVFVVAWNLGYAVPLDLFLGGVFLWTLVVVGYAVARERDLSVTG